MEHTNTNTTPRHKIGDPSDERLRGKQFGKRAPGRKLELTRYKSYNRH
jgi:hypothetical protein